MTAELDELESRQAPSEGREPDRLACGHHRSLAVYSAERPGTFLYCELCDQISGRRDAEQMERELKQQLKKARDDLVSEVDAHGKTVMQLAAALNDSHQRSSDTGVGVTDSAMFYLRRRIEALESFLPQDDDGSVAAELAAMRELATLATRTDAQAAGDDIEGLRKDAARYRWLRVQHWSNSDVCIVRHPKNAVRLGHECPSDERLDELIDAAIAQASARVGS